jgi:hypothetical protein
MDGPDTSESWLTMAPFAHSNDSGFTVDFSTRALWLMRGRDRAGNDFETGHVQPA